MRRLAKQSPAQAVSDRIPTPTRFADGWYILASDVGRRVYFLALEE